MESISKLIPALLMASNEGDPLERGAVFFRTPRLEDAAKAFRPFQINRIKMQGVAPIRWEIDFYAGEVMEDVYGTIRGEDEVIQYATLWI